MAPERRNRRKDPNGPRSPEGKCQRIHSKAVFTGAVIGVCGGIGPASVDHLRVDCRRMPRILDSLGTVASGGGGNHDGERVAG